MEVTEDAALGGRLTLRQPAKGYRFAVDAFLLAACCQAHAGDRILDLGCGMGAATLALARMFPKITCHGIDKLPELIELATANASLNSLQDRVTFSPGNVSDWRDWPDAGDYDHAIANPPYLERGVMTVSKHPIKAASTEEDENGLAIWVEAAAGSLRQGGSVTFIHRADRLSDLLKAMSSAFGGIVVLPIQPFANAPARRVIVLGRKGSKAPLSLLPAFVLHEAGGSWSARARSILEEALPFDLEQAAGNMATAPMAIDD